MSTVHQAGAKLSTKDTTVNPSRSLFSRLQSCDTVDSGTQAKQQREINVTVEISTGGCGSSRMGI